LAPDEWQRFVLEDWLARGGKGGKFASLTCGLSVPRQNGKNAILEMRELFGIVQLGEKFLHTAHEVKTARKAFIRLASFFENERKWPELAELVKDIRRTNGQEAIVLTNGGSVEFVARSKGSGRGFTVDVLVCDEAQELSDDALEALMPTTSASPQQNPQWIFTGTPPGPTANGEVFSRTRDDALSGKSSRLCWKFVRGPT
jgi:phage terminase large subunit-like protein